MRAAIKNLAIYWPSCRSKLISLLLLGLSASYCAQVHAQPLACYFPTESNVTYSQVLALAIDEPNQILQYGEAPLQFGELWLPPFQPTADFSVKPPLVILIHGGCWLNAYDIAHTHALSTALAQSGYAVWAPEYRRTGDEGGGWPGSYHDIKQAINFILNASTQQIDLSKVALVGHSAGGHLALLAGGELSESVAAVIGLAAIIDIAEYAKGSNSCEAATPSFMAGTPQEKPADYAQANPIQQPLHPNTVLIHGTADAIVSIEQAQLLADRLQKVEGAGHFDMVHSGTPAFQELLKQLARALP